MRVSSITNPYTFFIKNPAFLLHCTMFLAILGSWIVNAERSKNNQAFSPPPSSFGVDLNPKPNRLGFFFAWEATPLFNRHFPLEIYQGE